MNMTEELTPVGNRTERQNRYGIIWFHRETVVKSLIQETKSRHRLESNPAVIPSPQPQSIFLASRRAASI
jgi:hypothetical protein